MLTGLRDSRMGGRDGRGTGCPEGGGKTSLAKSFVLSELSIESGKM